MQSDRPVRWPPGGRAGLASWLAILLASSLVAYFKLSGGHSSGVAGTGSEHNSKRADRTRAVMCSMLGLVPSSTLVVDTQQLTRTHGHGRMHRIERAVDARTCGHAACAGSVQADDVVSSTQMCRERWSRSSASRWRANGALAAPNLFGT